MTPRTRSSLLDAFEELSKRFALCRDVIIQGQPFAGPRREVDDVLSVKAGAFLLSALDNGYLKSCNSAIWDPRRQHNLAFEKLGLNSQPQHPELLDELLRPIMDVEAVEIL